ncbi:hypothetical protein INT45_009552 [Circinella minor]|uniref:Uncharacterized protein n=1 Tax=Circinella minor TaxID=1195481 RepID=A0A8H7SBY0_9FUNG|nr:hypothetical protein INT45_009552 [Circinella minor]
MNDEEIPPVSVRQRAAAINRSLKEEQNKFQNSINKKASDYTTKARAPWRSVGVNAKSSLPLHRPVLPSSTRPTSSLNTSLPQRKVDRTHNDNINSKRNSNIHSKMPYRPTAIITTATTNTGMNTTATKLPRRGTFVSSTAAPTTTKTSTTEISSKLGKRQLPETNDEHVHFNKYQKVPITNEHRLSRGSSSLNHYATTATTKSTFAEKQRRSPSISGSSVASTTSFPIHYDDKVANLYAQYMQWQLITLDADESTDRRRIEEENRLWGIYNILWELRQNHDKDDPTVIKINNRLKEFSIVYEQFQDIIQGGTGTLKLSDGLIQNLINIIQDLRLNTRDLLNKTGRIETNLDELETDIRALEECYQIITSVAQLEAENQSLSAIL